MSFETDFDAAFTTLLGKAVGAITPTAIQPVPTTTGTSNVAAVTAGIEYVIEGGGVAITNGNAGGLIVPLTGVITKVELQEFDGISGSITVDIGKGAPGSSPGFGSITGGSTPHITSGRHYSDSGLGGWTTTLSYGDALRYTVSGASTIRRVTVMLYVRRTDIFGVTT